MYLQIMYDRDVLSKNDFLGSVTFTLDNLKKIAGNVQVGYHTCV